MRVIWLFALTPAAALLLSAVPAAAQWTPAGVSVCGDSCLADIPLAIPDGVGGTFIAWREHRAYPVTDEDVFAQRITGAGKVAPGWPAEGVPVCVAIKSQGLTSIVLDGAGGVLVAWVDLRNGGSGGTSADVYVQRLLGDGTIVPGWPINGAPATRAADYQGAPQIAPDGLGGAYMVWDDWRNYPATRDVDVYAQHLTSGGQAAGGWPQDGLPVCTAPGDQYPTGIIPDGAGGAVMVWDDSRSGNGGVYGQRLLADGAIAPGWAPNGLALLLGRVRPSVVPDGAGGFYVGCSTDNGGFDQDYYVQRFTIDGARAPGWPEGGVLVCSAPQVRVGLEVVPDGFGGVLLTWYDYRPSPSGSSEIYALRLRPDGALAPGWTVNGVRVSDDTGPGNEFDQSIAPDGLGGAYIAWEWETNYGRPSLVQHLTASGTVAAGWPPYGVRLAPTSYQFEPHVVEDEARGAIVVWDWNHLYAQRFQSDGPVAVQVSLVRADVDPDRVTLVWHVADALSFHGTVERRSASSGWRPLAALSADGTGRIEYQDRSVAAGERYAYRLAYSEDGGERHTVETWVEVPRTLALALEGLRPNPAVEGLTVSFTLPSPEPAYLELLDSGGRRVMGREVGSLGVGHHVLRLESSVRPAPGVYWLRLTQRQHTATARGVVMR